MKYLSLFSGIGGFELGILKAHVEITHGNANRRSKKDSQEIAKIWERLESAQGKKATDQIRRSSKLSHRNNDKRAPHCVGYSEIDSYAGKIYQTHFPVHKAYGDITKITAEELPKFDLLVGGFPCQSFSIAGKRGGFDDTRGTMFFEIARILRAKQPHLLLLENVKGLLSHDQGKTFATIVATLDELGYDLQWQVLNSKNFGVPQNRERVFIIGNLRGTPRPKVFPFEGNGKEVTDLEYIGAVMSDKNQKWLEDGKQLSRNFPQGQRVYSSAGISATLASQAAGLGAKTGLYRIVQRARGFNKGGSLKIAPTLTGKSYQNNNHVNAIRRLTPIECERLQGFPDGWTKFGKSLRVDSKGLELISDTQRYKVLGNAVTVNVIQEIFKRILKTQE